MADVRVSAAINTTSELDTYATHYAAKGKGGLREVADHAARNAITTERRAAGMLVYTQNDGLYWQLKAAPWNNNDGDWQQFTAASEALDSDLQVIAGLTPTANDVMQYKSGAWAGRSPSQVKTDLVLVKSDVGLTNVDNTSDAAKPVSSLQQTAINAKLNASALDTDVALATNSDARVASQKATKTYVDNKAYGSLDLFNVKAYGALGNGSNDDTSSIQAAHNAASAAGGGTVYVPPGTYKLTSALALASKVHWLGASASESTGGSTIRQTSTTADAFRGTITTTSLSNISFKNLRIEGPGSGTGNGIYLKNTGSAGEHPPFTYFNFENVYIAGFGSYACNAEGLIVSTLTTVIAESCTNGFYMNGAAAGAYTSVNTSVTFQNCYANGCSGFGYNVTHSTYMSLIGCAADSNNTGYRLLACESVSFTGCGVEYGDPDAATPGDGVKIEDSRQVGLYNFFSYRNKHYAYWVTGTSTGVTLMGCQENTPTGATNSLKIDAGSSVSTLDCGFVTAVGNAGTLNNLNA